MNNPNNSDCLGKREKEKKERERESRSKPGISFNFPFFLFFFQKVRRINESHGERRLRQLLQINVLAAGIRSISSEAGEATRWRIFRSHRTVSQAE